MEYVLNESGVGQGSAPFSVIMIHMGSSKACKLAKTARIGGL